MEIIIAVALVAGNLAAIVAHVVALEVRYENRGQSAAISIGGFFVAIVSLVSLVALGSAHEVLGFLVGFSAFLNVISFLLGPMSAGSEA